MPPNPPTPIPPHTHTLWLLHSEKRVILRKIIRWSGTFMCFFAYNCNECCSYSTMNIIQRKWVCMCRRCRWQSRYCSLFCTFCQTLQPMMMTMMQWAITTAKDTMRIHMNAFVSFSPSQSLYLNIFFLFIPSISRWAINFILLNSLFFLFARWLFVKGKMVANKLKCTPMEIRSSCAFGGSVRVLLMARLFTTSRKCSVERKLYTHTDAKSNDWR